MGGSGKLLQPDAGQPVLGGDGGGICLHQLDHCGAGDLRGDQRALLLEELVQRLAGASRVRLDGRLADAGLRQARWGSAAGEGDVQTVARCLVLGVPRDEALCGLGARVSTAER